MEERAETIKVEAKAIVEKRIFCIVFVLFDVKSQMRKNSEVRKKKGLETKCSVVFILEGGTIFKFLGCLSARQSNPPALYERVVIN